jgi:serine/threonine protein kinase
MSENMLEKDGMYMTSPPSATPLLGFDSTTNQRAGGRAASAPRVLTDAAEALAPDALVGLMIGQFKLLEVIGYGGFGVVYLAEHLQLKQRFALKLVRAMQKNDPAVLKRFQREANTLAELNHPNIVRLNDFGQLGEFGLYFAMEYLHGVDLKEAIASSFPMSNQRIHSIVGQMCDALYYMHGKGIYHRDMKPANVILVPSNEEGGEERVKLIDFGIASTVTEDTHLTQTGMLMGSIPYISPEQARGNSAHIDGRADLYSLGIMLYQMCTQQLPYQSNHIPGMITHHLFTPPPPLSQYRPEQVWSPALDAFIAKALAKKAEDRFPDALVFWREFEQALESQPAIGLMESRPQHSQFEEDSGDAVWLTPIEEEEGHLPPTLVDGNDAATMLFSDNVIKREKEDFFDGLLSLDECEDEGPTRVEAVSLLSPSSDGLDAVEVGFGPSDRSMVRPFVFQQEAEKAAPGTLGANDEGRAFGWLREVSIFLVCMCLGGWAGYELLFRKPAPPPVRRSVPSLRLPSLRLPPRVPRRLAVVARPKRKERWQHRLLSSPPGAIVFVGSQMVGRTPHVMTGTPGSKVTVMLQLPGYAPSKRDIHFITSSAQETIKLSPVVVKQRVAVPARRRYIVPRRSTKRKPRPRPRPRRRKKIYDVDDPF